MWGSETLTTVVSSTSMKVPNITEIAMIQGLIWWSVPGCVGMHLHRRENSVHHVLLAERGSEHGVVQLRVVPHTFIVMLDIGRTLPITLTNGFGSGVLRTQESTHILNALLQRGVDKQVKDVQTV